MALPRYLVATSRRLSMRLCDPANGWQDHYAHMSVNPLDAGGRTNETDAVEDHFSVADRRDTTRGFA